MLRTLSLTPGVTMLEELVSLTSPEGQEGESTRAASERRQQQCWQYWAPLAVLSLLAVAVVGHGVVRDLRRDWAPCDPSSSLMAKHFYCYNSSRSPGVHEDAHPQ